MEQNSQDRSGAEESGEKEKLGFVKSPRIVEYELFGPNSPYPEKWRVFNFIKYRIQDNKTKDEAQRLSRDLIVRETGVWKNNFSRIIEDLIQDKLIQVEKGKYRDSTFTYWLSKERFRGSVIAKDKPKKNVDKYGKKDNQSQTEHQNHVSEHQNDVSEHQNGVETNVSGAESLGKIFSRSLSPRALTYRSPWGKKPKETHVSLGERKPNPPIEIQKIWLEETGGETDIHEWMAQKGVLNESNID